MTKPSKPPLTAEALMQAVGGLRPLEEITFAGNKDQPVELEKCQFIITDYTPNSRIWLEAKEPPHSHVRPGGIDDHSPSYADFVVIISPRKIIVARPIQQIGPIGPVATLSNDIGGECGGECDEQMGKICEEASKRLDWDNWEDTILFRVFTPYTRQVPSLDHALDRMDAEEPTEPDMARYLFPERVRQYTQIFNNYFGKFKCHGNKIFHLSGYHAFRGADTSIHSSRIAVADVTTVRKKVLPWSRLVTENHDEIKVGFPLVITCAHQTRQMNKHKPRMTARPCRRFLESDGEEEEGEEDDDEDGNWVNYTQDDFDI